MKKIMSLILIVGLLLSGCGQLETQLNALFDGDNSGSTSESVADADVYGEIDRLLNSPDSSSSELSSRFTFVAMLMDEAESIEFTDENESGTYHIAFISRNFEQYFLLEVSDIAQTFHSGDIVKITGELNGFVYWTQDNAQKEVLDIKALEMEAYTPPEIETNGSSTIDIDGNQIEFLGAHRSRAMMSDVVVVYFNHTNNGTTDAMPDFSNFYVEYAGNEVNSVIFSPEDVDPSALAGTFSNKTYAGKTQLYYKTYTVEEESTDEVIYFSIYDDEFRMTHDIGVPIADSLEALYGDGAEPVEE